jgi:hypothetical protein
MKWRRRGHPSLFLLVFLMCPAAVADQVRWAPIFFMDDQIFPSYILATAAWKGSNAQISKNVGGRQFSTIGERNEVFAVAVENPAPNTRLTLQARIDAIAEPSEFETVLQDAGTTYLGFPTIRYRYDYLTKLKQPIIANATIRLFLDGAPFGQMTQAVRVRSINDAPYAFKQPDGSYDDLSWMFAAYVNENHPWIDQLLGEARYSTPRGFIGYQGAPQDVYEQVFAIWNVLQRRGVRYSNITTPTGYSDKVFSQYVRSFEDSVRSSQANCVDGSVLIASILRRIGIDPFLVRVPGHMYLGFYVDANHSSAAYLETTMIGQTDLGQYPRDGSLAAAISALGGRASQNQASWNSFMNALYAGAQRAEKDAPFFSRFNFPAYEVLDIAEQRKLGVLPISR